MSRALRSTRAFLPYPAAAVPHAPAGPLAGLTFAVKDIFDVAGYPTGAGNPHVLVRSGIKPFHAAAVAALLDAGAQFVGKTVTDELAYSATGNNAHFGAPLNGAALDRITGGSSSGSASAVSNVQCDFALGSDTGGSVRGPASHCGLYGMRPTQDRIALAGCYSLCVTFDTCGFFARDAQTFLRGARVLLGPDAAPLPAQPRVLIAEDLFEMLSPEVRETYRPGIAAIEAAWGKATPVSIAVEGVATLAELYTAYRALQGWEAWETQQEPIERDGFCMGPDVAARFAFSRAITAEQAASATAIRQRFAAHLAEILGRDAVLILPTMPDVAPLREIPPDDLESYRNTATHLLGLAPLAGVPQVSMPFAGRLGAPLGLSLIAPRGSDASLVERIAGLAVPATAVRAPGTLPDDSPFVRESVDYAAAIVASAVPGTGLDDTALAGLGWYARRMSGAPIQPGDLRAVADIAQLAVAAVRTAARRDLHWTNDRQALPPLLFASAGPRRSAVTEGVAGGAEGLKVRESGPNVNPALALDRSITELVSAIHSGETRAETVIRRCLDAIAQEGDSIPGAAPSTVTGFVRTRGSRAIDDARARDAATQKGPLAGVPFARKDMYFRDDDLCECGSLVLTGYRPSLNATVVQRLEAAGAVDIGALHMAEFAMSPTGVNAHLGDGRNPWALEPHVSGGSSSGSGIAVARRLASATLGSDTGGSIRLPSAICGVTGIKPTNHLISVHGVMPLSPSMDCVGFLTQSARDCARLMSAVVGPDPLDSNCIATRTVDYEAGISAPLSAGIRIAVPRFAAGDKLTEEVRMLLMSAVGVFQDAGAEIVTVDVPDFTEMGALGNVINMSEAAAMHASWLDARPLDYGTQVRSRLERGLLYSSAQYVQAMRLRGPLLERFLREAMPDADALLLPVLPHAVPTIASTLVGSGAEIEAWFGRFSYWTRAINYLGLPALALPMGFTSNGMPNGLQLVGRALDEATLLRIGHQYQLHTDWHRRAPSPV